MIDAASAEARIRHVRYCPFPTGVAVVIVEPNPIDLKIAERFAESVQEAANRASTIVADTLSFSRRTTTEFDAINLHLDNAIAASRRRGSDVFRNIDAQLDVEAYEMDQREKRGLTGSNGGDDE